MTDDELEQRIEDAYQYYIECCGSPKSVDGMLVHTTATPEQAWERLCELIAQRSPEQVEKMEKGMGLVRENI